MGGAGGFDNSFPLLMLNGAQIVTENSRQLNILYVKNSEDKLDDWGKGGGSCCYVHT